MELLRQFYLKGYLNLLYITHFLLLIINYLHFTTKNIGE